MVVPHFKNRKICYFRVGRVQYSSTHDGILTGQKGNEDRSGPAQPALPS